MSPSIDLPGNALVAMTRDSLLALRAALFRDVGPNAAALLQEAGYAGGQAMFDAFSRWLAARGLPAPESLPAAEFGAHATEFFRETGWGSIELGALESVATRRLGRLGRERSRVSARVSRLLLHVGRDRRFLRPTGRRAAGGDGSRVPLDGRRALPVSRRERRDDAARVRRDGTGRRRTPNAVAARAVSEPAALSRLRARRA